MPAYDGKKLALFHGNRWTFMFATILSLVCATVLAAMNGTLLPRIELNRENERNQIILGCFGVTFDEQTTGTEIKQAYDEMIEAHTLTLDDGRDVQFYTMSKDGRLDAVAIQVEGVGLWSRIHGYVAIEAADFETIRQVNFDKQEETPGLGGEIVADWFRAQFTGKSILHEGVPVRHMVAKPGQAKAHQVDGISGATITSVAVGDMLHHGFEQAVRVAEQLRAEVSDT